MDVVVVPLVLQEAEVGPLLDLLRRRERSGLVVNHYLDGPDRYRLLYGGPVFPTINDELTGLSDNSGELEVKLSIAQLTSTTTPQKP